ncbi:hypothetical protein F383_25077 [Gossypium arboreum]|uniref:Uncharacterized protein n=1 Tax=Gossypium arboreum TaxID=29729 RepID=A0A0B0P1P4_GOSAR|nr:hypothetical protein F383_25077 [Gossypium arboreum]
MSEASITLSPKAFDIASLNVLSVACIWTYSFCLVSCYFSHKCWHIWM